MAGFCVFFLNVSALKKKISNFFLFPKPSFRHRHTHKSLITTGILFEANSNWLEVSTNILFPVFVHFRNRKIRPPLRTNPATRGIKKLWESEQICQPQFIWCLQMGAEGWGTPGAEAVICPGGCDTSFQGSLNREVGLADKGPENLACWQAWGGGGPSLKQSTNKQTNPQENTLLMFQIPRHLPDHPGRMFFNRHSKKKKKVKERKRALFLFLPFLSKFNLSSSCK